MKKIFTILSLALLYKASIAQIKGSVRSTDPQNPGFTVGNVSWSFKKVPNVVFWETGKVEVNGDTIKNIIMLADELNKQGRLLEEAKTAITLMEDSYVNKKNKKRFDAIIKKLGLSIKKN